MKYKNYLTHISIVILFIPILIVLVSPVTVHAADLTLNSASGSVGSKITISGQDFAGSLATIYWDEKIVATDIPIDEAGNLNYELTIPNAARGEHIIDITDDSNWSASTASISFTVIPGIKVAPQITTEYSQISITGYSFEDYEKGITITWDGSKATTYAITADRLGTWNVIFRIPGTSKGEHFIGAFGDTTTAAEIGETKIIVTPWVIVEPLSGPVGTKLIIKGWGFRTGEDGITVTWDNKIIQPNITAEAGGEVIIDGSRRPDGTPRYSVYVPPTPQGEHLIGVYGSSFTPKGILPDTKFQVVPAMELKPTSGSAGTQVTITGTGYAKTDVITVSFDDTVIDTVITTDEEGSFEATFIVPKTDKEKHAIAVMDSHNNSVTASFTTEYVAAISTPQLVAPEQGATVTIFNSIGSVLSGTFKYLTGVTDFLRGSPPEIHTLSPITFKWSEPDKPGSTRYLLQVAHDDSFSAPVLEMEIIDNSEYTPSEKHILPAGYYSWRVKNISSTDTESPWSEVYEFEITSMAPITIILTSVIVVLIVAAIVFGLLMLYLNLSHR